MEINSTATGNSPVAQEKPHLFSYPDIFLIRIPSMFYGIPLIAPNSGTANSQKILSISKTIIQSFQFSHR